MRLVIGWEVFCLLKYRVDRGVDFVSGPVVALSFPSGVALYCPSVPSLASNIYP